MSSTPCRVLVIEDNVAIRDALKLGLELEGFAFRQAANGQEALELLGQPPLPEVILLDLLMPDMDGYEFLDRIRKDPRPEIAKIPVLVLSAVAQLAKKKELAQAQGVLAKPVKFEDLYEAIRKFTTR
jgi:CheY-like chemotaxis protein